VQDLYKFLTAKCKERGVKIEGLPERFDFKFSRTTIYRYMKGILHITKDVQDSFVKLLGLNSEEQAQFAQLISLSTFDETMLAARRKIDKFLFAPKNNQQEFPETDCVYYDRDRYLRTIDEIFSMILDQAGWDDFSCDVKIIGCTQDELLVYVSDFAQKLLSTSPASRVEQLVTFCENDFLQSTEFLLDILPLIVLGMYTVYYRESVTGDCTKIFMGDSMLISCKYTENGAPREKYYALSFIDQAMPECISFEDPFMLSFWTKNYAHLKRCYPFALTHTTDMASMEDELKRLEADHDEYLIKPNPCYNKIPVRVYRRLIDRITPDDIRHVASELMQRGVQDDAEARAILDAMLLSIEERHGSSYKNRHVDVYSKEGLEEFAKTGRISDHMGALPPFDKEEVREILMCIRDRNRDPKDPYTLYVVDKLQYRYYFVVIKGHGLFIECDQHLVEKGSYIFLHVCNHSLLEVFCDYIENHLPVNHVLPAAEITAFIGGLIEKYCA